MVNYHYYDALLTFMFMTLSMVTGALILLTKRRGRVFIILHIVFAIIAYIMMLVSIIRAPRF